jgi:hypothetical protein
VGRNGFAYGPSIRHAIIYGQSSVCVAGLALLLDLFDGRIGMSLLLHIGSTPGE